MLLEVLQRVIDVVNVRKEEVRSFKTMFKEPES
jgi:hypothetical protein